MPDLDAAERFLAASARVVERRWFQCAFRDGDPQAVVDAVRAYRNPDGGLGHGLEPDGRGPESQPAAVLTGLTILDRAGAWDDDLAAGVCDWFAAVAPAGGGAPFVMPGVEDWPHAPWWAVQPGLPASLTGTGPSLGLLLAHGVRHPWVTAATTWLLDALEGDDDLGVYDLRGAFAALGALGAEPRAVAALKRLGPAVLAAVSVPDDSGEVHGALRFVDAPDHPAIGGAVPRAAVDADLDALAAGQQSDGGWTVSFPAWSAAASADWRGFATVEALTTLRRFGRPA